MIIQPAADFYLCRVNHPALTAGGLHVPQQAQRPKLEVVAVGEGITFGVPGDTLVIGPGHVLTIEGHDDYRLVHVEAVVGLMPKAH